MSITCQRLLTEMGHRAWSGFNKDDMVFGNEDAQTAQAELNVALRYLINLIDFPFKRQETEIVTRSGANGYYAPDGQINHIYNSKNVELKYIGNADGIDTKKQGEPTSYYFDYSNPDGKTLNLYPLPITRDKLKVVYNVYKPVLDKNGIDYKFEFENEDDILNLPDDIAPLFMDCLVLRTMVTNNKDEQDENYRPTINEFNEHWKVFKKACKPARTETYVIW